jgi:indolepyruvate ferredoxin oxidoreductase beta subunit
MKTFNCYIAGVGGQGTVLASKLIAAAAMKRGFNVRTTEFIGMAQRGGSVFGHLRIGDEIHSPLIPMGGADVLLGFDPTEAVRQLAFLAEGGKVVCADGAPDMEDYLINNTDGAIVIPAAQVKEKYTKMLNVAMIGAAAECKVFPFDTEALLEAISEMPRFRDENLKAFELGRKLYNERS